MEYTYIEKRYNVMRLASIEAFSGIKGGVNGNCKDVYFLRATGVNERYAEDVASMDGVQTARMRSGQGIYNRVRMFPKDIGGDRAAQYMGCYQNWLDTGRQKLFTLKLGEEAGVGELLGTGCRKVLEVYRACNPGLNECIEKNFVVKLLYWLDEMASEYLREWDPRRTMKFVAQGVVKQQEYFFCYFLTLLGIDVLLLQNEADIEEKLEALHLSGQVVLGEKKALILEDYDSRKRAAETGAFGAASPGNRQTDMAAASPGSRQADMGAASPGNGQAASPMPRVVLPPRTHKASGNRGVGADLGPGGSSGTVLGGSPGTGSGEAAHSHPAAAFGTAPGGRGEASRSTAPGSGMPRNGGVPGSFGRRETAPAAPRTGGARRELDFEELALRASSVVMIAIHDGRGDIIGSGSGIMIGRKGYILTNDHVARGGKYYSVRIENDENMYRTDEIIKYNSLLDLAVIRIDRNLQPLPVYRGGRPLVRGQKVVAIGSPLGLFNSVSDGIISGFRRVKDVDMIQFTAPTSHGSSGGAVLNMYGEVIGVSTAGIDEGQNINLAVGYEFINTFIQGFQ